MAYWIGYNKTGIGEVIRERGYDSLTKTRKIAAAVMKKENYDWAAIYTSKFTRYHIETLDMNRGEIYLAKFNHKEKRITQYVLKSDGTLGKRVL